jgi:hypothetical protein
MQLPNMYFSSTLIVLKNTAKLSAISLHFLLLYDCHRQRNLFITQTAHSFTATQLEAHFCGIVLYIVSAATDLPNHHNTVRQKHQMPTKYWRWSYSCDQTVATAKSFTSVTNSTTTHAIKLWHSSPTTEAINNYPNQASILDFLITVWTQPEDWHVNRPALWPSTQMSQTDESCSTSTHPSTVHPQDCSQDNCGPKHDTHTAEPQCWNW